jgi:TolB-like protein
MCVLLTSPLAVAILLATAPATPPTRKASPVQPARTWTDVPLPPPPVLRPPAAAATSTAPARPATARKKIAVMDLKAIQGVAAGSVEILGSVVAADLARQGMDVVSKSDIQAMLGFQKERQLLGCTEDASCIADIGGSLGVDYVLTGQVGQIGTQYNLSLLVVDSRKAKVVTRLSSFCEANEDALVKAARASTGTIVVAILGGTAAQGGQKASVPFTRSPRTAWAAWGTSAALLAGGAIVGVAAKGKYDDLAAQRSAPNYIDIYAREKGSIRTLNLAADALFASGAIVAGLGTWVWFRQEKAPITVAPVISGDGLGLQLAGSF